MRLGLTTIDLAGRSTTSYTTEIPKRIPTYQHFIGESHYPNQTFHILTGEFKRHNW